jgi:hypothetical protein
LSWQLKSALCNDIFKACYALVIEFTLLRNKTVRLRVLIRKTHRWLGLIIGIQVLFWVLGGLLMSSFPIDQVHGDHLRKEVTPVELDISKLYSLVAIVEASGLNIIETQTTMGYYGPQYRLTDTEKKYYFFNALTGKSLPSLIEAQAIEIAQFLYTGSASVLSSTQVTSNSTEYRKRLPAWRVEFDDSESSTLYIATDNGQLMSVRNSMWRVFDFVWMLHIMDYEERDDFNGWLLIIAAAIALLFTLSGGYLVVKSFRRKDFGV